MAAVTFTVAATAWTARNFADYLYHHPIHIGFASQPSQLVRGKAFEQAEVRKLRLNWPVVIAPKFFQTDLGPRYLDACVYDSWYMATLRGGIFPNFCIEFKSTPRSAWRYYFSRQAEKDQLIRRKYPWIHIHLIWEPL